MYHELIYHLDLCILSYHLYAQTLVWPMDPYYEQMARKTTSRRTNFMAEVRKIDQARFPEHLDPIRYDYDRIDPRKPCFASPELKKWLVFNAPTAITGSIRQTYLTTREGLVTEIQTQTPAPQGSTDDLYCFEGVTGGINSLSGQKSMMGFVLARQLDNSQDYDVHIVFRGSRSGDAKRAGRQGLLGHGNPDWVTDMDLNTLVENKWISKVGHCCRGFSTSISDFINGSIMDSLLHIAANRTESPRHIYVTGHSLGGALAAHFTSAVSIGSLVPSGNLMNDELKSWPWSDIRLITFSAPSVGGETFHYAFNSKVYARRVVLGNDPITQEIRNYHVGARIRLRPDIKKPSTADHEPYRVRRELIKFIKDTWPDEANNVPANSGEAHADEPWKIYTSFKDVLTHPKFNKDNRQNIVASLGNDFGDNLKKYLDILATVLLLDSSYKKGYLSKQNTKETKGNAIKNIKLFLTSSLTKQVEEWKKTRTPLDDTSTYNFMGLCLALNHLTQTPNDAGNLPTELSTIIKNL